MIHHKMLDHLHRFWTQTATVQSQSQAINAFGDVNSTWSNRSSAAQVKVRIAQASKTQMENAQRSGYIVTNQVFIPGYHSAVQLSDRILTTSVAYEVREIHFDSQQEMTRLLVRRVEGPTT